MDQRLSSINLTDHSTNFLNVDQHHQLVDRAQGIDMIRGVIILAILVININYISTPSLVRYNPLAFGDFGLLDQWVWAFEYSLVKQRFMPILALMYGVGIYLFAQKYERKNQNATPYFVKRSIALAVIGIAHAYLIWDGDILFAYAVCGLCAYWLRNLSDRWLLSIGVFLTIAPVLPEVYEISKELLERGPLFFASAEEPAFWYPEQPKIAELSAVYQASWWQLTPARISTAMGRQTTDLLYFNLWRCTGLMLLGIVMIRNGFLLGKQNYRKGLLLSLAIGLPVSLVSTALYIQSGYNFNFFNTYLTLAFYLGTLCLAYAYLSLLILWAGSNRFEKLKQAIANVGKMALTLYISQNLICAIIFYGWGFDLYAKVARSELMLITLAILLFQFIFAQFWLKRFKHGPLEAIWRYSYSKRPGKMAVPQMG